MITTPEQARRAGYVQRIEWETGDGFGGAALVKVGTDFDADFRAYCLEDDELLTLHGWAIFTAAEEVA